MKKGMKWNKGFLGMAALFLLALLALPLKVRAEGVLDGYSDGKIYDVTAYGADKTGSKSCDSAISDLMAEIKQDIRKDELDGKSRVVLYFPEGNYNFGGSIRLFDGMAVVAEDGAVIRSAKDVCLRFLFIKNASVEGGTWIGHGGDTLMHFNGCSGVSVKNLKVQSAKMGLKWGGTTGTVENVTVSGCTDLGMSLTTKSKATIRNCVFDKNGYAYPKGLGHGIGVYTGSTITISDSRISNSRECGISLKAGSAVAVNCKLQGNGRQGVGTEGKCSMNLKNCDIYKNGYKDKMNGVILVDGSTGTFTGCTFRSNKVTGLLVNDGGTKATVKSCTFKGNGTQNIYAENMGSGRLNLTVDGCKFYKTKTEHSVRVHARSKSGYKLTVKGKNKFYKLKNRFTYWIGSSVTYK